MTLALPRPDTGVRETDRAELARPDRNSSELPGLDEIIALAQELAVRETIGVTRSERAQHEIVESSVDEKLDENAIQIAGRICCRIGALKIPHPESPTADLLTASVGLAPWLESFRPSGQLGRRH
jgi:hypothetical protein